MGPHVPGRMRPRLVRRQLRGSTLRLRQLLAAVALPLLLGCADRSADVAADPASGTTVVDHAGRSHDFTTPAVRIVSLVPSATSTLIALGLEDRIVGRTDYDDDPRLADVPSVGGGLEPSLEAITALRPDLVIRFEGEQDPTTPARLDDLGIAHMGVRPVGLDDIFATNELIGAATGQRASADSLSSAIRAGLDQIRADAEGRPAVRVAFLLGGTPPWVSGPGTFVSEVVELAGGVNAFADLPAPWTSVGREEFLVRAIDVLLAPDGRSVRADLAPGARIVTVGDALDQPGPDIVEAARLVFDAIHESGRP